MKNLKKKTTSLKDLKIEKVELKTIKGGPSRRAEIDHVGAYNFMVEVSGSGG